MFTLPTRFTAPVERARAARHTLTQPHVLATTGVAVAASVVIGAFGISPSDAAETAAGAGGAAAAKTTSISDTALAAERAETAASRAAQQRSDIKARQVAAEKAAARKAAARKAAAKKAKALAHAQKNPKAVAQSLLADYGFGSGQWQCLETLWNGESGWNYTAANASSGAYGIPQALPGSKMSSEGADWATNPVTQIRWGLGYIADRYGTPCGAWSFKQGHGWY